MSVGNDILFAIEELVADHVPADKWAEFERLTYLLRIWNSLVNHGHGKDFEINWQIVHDKGIHSPYDCKLFEKEFREAGVDLTVGKYAMDPKRIAEIELNK